MYDIHTLTTYVDASHAAEVESLFYQFEENALNKITLKNPKTARLLSIFTGFIGIDRLYQGGAKMMLIKLCTLVFTLGTWYIVDIYYTAECVKEDNYKKLIGLMA